MLKLNKLTFGDDLMSKKTKASAMERPDNALSHNHDKHITKFEYVCLMLARIGGMFGTTLTGTLAAAFLHELYYGPVGVNADEIAEILTEKEKSKKG